MAHFVQDVHVFQPTAGSIFIAKPDIAFTMARGTGWF